MVEPPYIKGKGKKSVYLYRCSSEVSQVYQYLSTKTSTPYPTIGIVNLPKVFVFWIRSMDGRLASHLPTLIDTKQQAISIIERSVPDMFIGYIAGLLYATGENWYLPKQICWQRLPKAELNLDSRPYYNGNHVITKCIIRRFQQILQSLQDRMTNSNACVLQEMHVICAVCT